MGKRSGEPTAAMQQLVSAFIAVVQARAQTFRGAGAQTKKKGTQCQKKFLTELKHKQHYSDDAVLNLRFLWAASDH